MVGIRTIADVRYDEWAPVYERICAAFDFDLVAERRAADRLRALAPQLDATTTLTRARSRIEGRDTVVVGLAPAAGPPPLWRLPPGGRKPAILAADGATQTCLTAGIVPDVVVTDLDGPVPSEASAQARGAFVIVHAHGDNLAALERWVPQLAGDLGGSWAGPPTPALIDVGGFTDGDRAAYLAAACGARRVLLWGFDFTHAVEPDARSRERKLAKLQWAERALGWLVTHDGAPVYRWTRDGAVAAYPPGPTSVGDSTQ